MNGLVPEIMDFGVYEILNNIGALFYDSRSKCFSVGSLRV